MFQDESELWISALTQTNLQLPEKFMGSGLNVEFWINSYKEHCSRSFAIFFFFFFWDLLVIPCGFHVVCVVLDMRVDFDAFLCGLDFQGCSRKS